MERAAFDYQKNILLSFFTLQNSGLGQLKHYGYNMAKHGIIALTRGFKFSEPNIYGDEGVKCYALAPWFANTGLVHSWVKSAHDNPGSWTYQGKSLTSIDAHEKAGEIPYVSVFQ